jgi:hypothetical protein
MKFKFNKKRNTIDFTKLPDSRVKKQNLGKVSGDTIDFRNQKAETSYPAITDKSQSQNSDSFIDFMSDSSSTQSIPTQNTSELKKDIQQNSSRIEDNSNEIYRLIQRIEVLERKLENFRDRGSF